MIATGDLVPVVVKPPKSMYALDRVYFDAGGEDRFKVTVYGKSPKAALVGMAKYMGSRQDVALRNRFANGGTEVDVVPRKISLAPKPKAKRRKKKLSDPGWF